MKTIRSDSMLVRVSSAATGQQQMRCFIVYYDGSAASLAALNSALDLREPNTTIIAVSCVLAPPSGLLRHVKNRARAALEGAVANAAERGALIRTETLQCDDLGRAIVDCAVGCSADIIFWGIERSEVEKGLNRAAEYVLKFAPSKVVLVGV